MADISKISVNDQTYNIKDATARQEQTELEASLGALAFKNEASGNFTPSGSVSAPTVTVSPTTKNVKVVNSVGSLPSWSANVSEETLAFTFSAGALPTTNNETVVTGIADASASQPVFTGTQGNVSVS